MKAATATVQAPVPLEVKARSPLGERVRPVDWEPKTSGAAAYTGDVDLPATLFARVLRSPHPHARIIDVDASDVRRAPGVQAVLTPEDLPDARYIHHGGPLSDRPVLAQGVVRFVGQEVAAVAAETPRQAEEALRRFRVRYRPLRAAVTMDEALAPRAPVIHDHAESNVAMAIERDWGDSEAAAGAVVTVNGRYSFGRQAHAAMETNSVLAQWDAEASELEIWVSTQAPYFIRKEVANALGLKIEQVTMHEVAVGGGFGSKSKISEHEVIAGALAIRAGRPVRLTLSRDEEFATTKSRHGFEVELETGADANGRLTHRRADILADNGGFNHSGPSVMGYGTLVMGSLYRTGRVRLRSRLVYTNKQPGGQFRGYGGPQVTFAIESQMDELAERLGIDPIELRLRNANRPGDVTHSGWRLGSARLVECLQRARAESDWETKRAFGGSGRGIGVAAAIHVTGAHVYEGAEQSSGAVEIASDGRVSVYFGGADAGTGQRTVLAQIAASELGLAPHAIDVVMMETSSTPPDMGAWSSRGTYMSGHAVGAAARASAAELRRLAGAELGGDPGAVTLADGRALVGGESISFAELVRAAGRGDRLRFEEEIVADIEPVNPETGVANLSGAYSFAAQVAEVEVDRDTGAVRVVDFIAIHDSGKPINPIGLEGQIVGGVAMGLGAALGEDLIHEGGRVASGSYIHYPLPRSADLPHIRAIALDGDDPKGPYGAKGVGEIGLMPTGAAVANAVAHAAGVRVRELPITPDKVLDGIHRGARGGRRRGYRLWRRPSRWWTAGVRAAYPRGFQTLLHRYGTKLARQPKPVGLDSIVEPRTVEEATASLAPASDTLPIAGGTDLIPARRQGIVQPRALVDVTCLDGFDEMCESESAELRIGAGVRLARLARDAPIEALRETAVRIASPQIREMATVAGNLCQRNRCWFFRSGFDCYKRGGVTCPCYAVNGDHRFYHAVAEAHRCQAVTPSDLATTLTALDARMLIAGSTGRRSVPIGDLFTGPGETVLKSDELLTEVVVPAAACERATSYRKLNLWEGDFAVVSACASVALAVDRTVEEARLVLGAVAPTPLRLERLERRMLGMRIDSEDELAAFCDSWASEAHPLARNEWKVDAASALLRRAIQGCGDVEPSRLAVSGADTGNGGSRSPRGGEQ